MNMVLPYTTVLWDIDGTLTDPKEGITRCIQYALEQMGRVVPSTDSLHWAIGPSLTYSFASLLETDQPEQIQVAISLYRERFTTTGLYENRLYPGIPELLASLQDHGVKNILATSKPHVFAHRILEYFGINAYFYDVVGSELNGQNVDKEDLITVALSLLPDRSIERVVMVGDRRFDVEGARHHGIDAISVLYGYGTREELEKADPTRMVGSVEELRCLLLTDNLR